MITKVFLNPGGEYRCTDFGKIKAPKSDKTQATPLPKSSYQVLNHERKNK